MGLLWKIEGEGLPAPSWLFGTMHVQDWRAFASVEFLMEKIKACDAFAAEFDLAGGMAALGAVGVMQMPEGQSLEMLLPPRKYQKLRKIFLKSTRLDLDFFKNQVPFAIVNLLGAEALEEEMPVCLDEHLWDFARRQGKSMHGIETLAEQLETLKKIPLEAQVKMLLDIGRNVGSHRRQVLHLVRLYVEGDVRRLFKSVKKGSKGLRKLLIYRRNEVMAERIAALAERQGTFAAIGAAHLAGGKGVVKLLKIRGLKIKSVKVEASAC